MGGKQSLEATVREEVTKYAKDRREVASRVFEAIDDDKSGYVDFSEYKSHIAAALGNRADEKILVLAFDKGDVDRDGNLSKVSPEQLSSGPPSALPAIAHITTNIVRRSLQR
jgi:Ca2+-binding EF-hand superfamily protein